MSLSLHELQIEDGTRVSQAFRRANELIAAKAIALHFVARVPFVCECSNPHCREFVVLRAEDYRAVHGRGRLVMLPGHEGEAEVFAS